MRADFALMVGNQDVLDNESQRYKLTDLSSLRNFSRLIETLFIRQKITRFKMESLSKI